MHSACDVPEDPVLYHPVHMETLPNWWDLGCGNKHSQAMSEVEEGNEFCHGS